MYLSIADAILYGWSLHESCSSFKNDLVRVHLKIRIAFDSHVKYTEMP